MPIYFLLIHSNTDKRCKTFPTQPFKTDKYCPVTEVVTSCRPLRLSPVLTSCTHHPSVHQSFCPRPVNITDAVLAARSLVEGRHRRLAMITITSMSLSISRKPSSVGSTACAPERNNHKRCKVLPHLVSCKSQRTMSLNVQTFENRKIWISVDQKVHV